MASKVMQRERRGQPSHRDDLRGELIAAAVAFVVREGHEGLSMRRLSEEIGVSSGAPYHHFPDRRALLTAVALAGYDLLFRETVVPEGMRGDGRAVLLHTFLNFIRFARGNPHLFTLMYESELVRPQLVPELAVAQETGFQMLRQEVGRLTPDLDERERSVRIAAIWSMVFGYALQWNRAMLRAYPLEPAPDELGPDVIKQALRLLD